MSVISRRHFSKLAAAAPLAANALSAPLPVRRLGKIDFRAGILGWGAQHIGGQRAEQPVVDRIVAEAIDNGLNYIDTAPNYGQSEERVGRALKGRRDKVFLVTKIETRTRADALGQVRESLRRLQTDHLDAVLFHNLGREDRYPDLASTLAETGSLGALLEAKKQGMIRHIGITTHSNTPRIRKAFELGVFEILMCPLNFVAPHIYGLEDKLLPAARRHGIAVVAMKVLGGPVRGAAARLTSDADYEDTFRYVWSLQDTAVAIAGFVTPEELRRGLAAARSFRPLNEKEHAALAERGKAMAAQWGPLWGPVA